MSTNQRRRLGFAVAIAASVLLMPQLATASLIYDSSVLLSAQGFGSAPRDLTVQSQGNNTTESGCVGVSGVGAITFGSCLTGGSVHDSNGVANLGGDEPHPLADDQKYGIPTLGSLGITSANQIGILFNATEPGGNSANITDVTLKFYSPTGALLGAIDGQQNFSSTNPGNGVAGFIFTVSSDELAYVNGLIGPNVILALESTITDVAGGPESYLIANLGTAPPCTGCSPNPTGLPVPEPASLVMLGTGLLGLGFIARRRREHDL